MKVKKLFGVFVMSAQMLAMPNIPTVAATNATAVGVSNVAAIEQGEIVRRGNSVERVNHAQSLDTLQSPALAIGQQTVPNTPTKSSALTALAPPASDAHKWFDLIV